jgi:hypothetical protein
MHLAAVSGSMHRSDGMGRLAWPVSAEPRNFWRVSGPTLPPAWFGIEGNCDALRMVTWISSLGHGYCLSFRHAYMDRFAGCACVK